MNRTTILIIGAAVVVLAYLFTRGNGLNSLAAQPQTSIFGNRSTLIPSAGPNTPVNTSGTASYRPFSMTSTPGGPPVVGAQVAGISGLINSIAAVFKGNAPSAGTLGAGTPLASGFSDTLLADQNVVPVNPATQPIPLPAPTAAQSNPSAFGVPVPPPPNISYPGVSPIQVDLSALAVGPPSPITSGSDFGSAMDAAITNPSYDQSPATPVDYASPSYVYDGGEAIAA